MGVVTLGSPNRKQQEHDRRQTENDGADCDYFQDQGSSRGKWHTSLLMPVAGGALIWIMRGTGYRQQGVPCGKDAIT